MVYKVYHFHLSRDELKYTKVTGLNRVTWPATESRVALAPPTRTSLACLLHAYYSAPVGEQSIDISLSVCVFVCLSANIYLELLLRSSRTFLWPWLGRPLAALRYVMYFRFYG